MRYFTLLFLSLLFPVFLFAQITNESFEGSDSSGSLEGWEDLCNNGTLWEEGAPGGGDWSLRLQSSNFQGCFPAYVLQTLPGVSNGDIVKISAWVKSETGIEAFVGLGVKTDTGTTVFAMDTTSSGMWMMRSVQGRFLLGPNDTPVVVLHAGWGGGPSAFWSLFDRVSLESPTALDWDPAHFDQLISLPAPNPAQGYTHFSLNLPHTLHNGILNLYNALGKKVRSHSLNPGESELELSLEGLSPGVYFYKLETEKGHSHARKLLVMR